MIAVAAGAGTSYSPPLARSNGGGSYTPVADDGSLCARHCATSQAVFSWWVANEVGLPHDAQKDGVSSRCASHETH